LTPRVVQQIVARIAVGVVPAVTERTEEEDMRPIVRAVFISLVVTLGIIAAAQESWASFAGGSRLLFYYTQRSIVNPGAGLGTAVTIMGITNQSSTDDVRIRFRVFNGSTCASTGTSSFDLSPRRTLRLNVGDFGSAAGFPEGWVDVWAINSLGSPIRWDQLAGKGTILDFGGVNTAAVTYEAAALFSDANRTTGTSSEQGQLMTNNGHINTWGALQGSVDFWGVGGSFGTGHRLIIIPVSENPGTAPVATSPNITWYRTNETQTRDADVAMPCMIASSLANLHPTPNFAATYPNDGTVSSGGNLDITSDGNKGIVGALFETGTTPNSLLVVHSLQQFISLGQESHE
jgi:hypothetical protein